jgi:hypothetical protein
MLTVCWRPVDAGDEGLDRALRASIDLRLRGAGYVVLTRNVCDIAPTVSFVADHDDFRSVTLTIRQRSGALVDNVHLSLAEGQAPRAQPDRLAVLLVNALNASARVVALAERRLATATLQVSASGVDVREGMDYLDAEDIRRGLGSTPRNARVDVRVAAHADRSTFMDVLEALFRAGWTTIRIHTHGDTVDQDLLPKADWSKKGTWLSLHLAQSDAALVWRTDRSCDEIPGSVDADSKELAALRAVIARCPPTGCFDRLVVHDTANDAFDLLEGLLLAGRALHAPVPLDWRGTSRPDPVCRVTTGLPVSEVDAFVRNRGYRIAHCAPRYRGNATVSLDIGTDGLPISTNVAFSEGYQMDESERYCVARTVSEIRFPPADHVVHVVYPMVFGSYSVKRGTL